MICAGNALNFFSSFSITIRDYVAVIIITVIILTKSTVEIFTLKQAIDYTESFCLVKVYFRWPECIVATEGWVVCVKLFAKHRAQLMFPAPRVHPYAVALRPLSAAFQARVSSYSPDNYISYLVSCILYPSAVL